MRFEFHEDWSQQRDSGHTLRTGIDVFRIAAGEINAYYDERRWPRVLEFGCGAGEVFPHFQFNRERYVGIDVSPTMLAEFRQRNPGVVTREADALQFRSTEQFDFIFSSNVIQYFSGRELAVILANVGAMLAPGGRAVFANVPDRRLRPLFEREAFRSSSRGIAIRAAAYCAGRAYAVALPRRSAPRIGYWHSRREMVEAASRLGLSTQFFGCLLYPCRFTAVFEHSSS